MLCGKLTFQTLSQIFTASTFKKIIQEEDFEQFNRCVLRNQNLLEIADGATNLEIIRKAYKCLDKNYRNEYLYKNALFNLLIKEKKLESTVVLNELRVNQSIADTVFINGESILYEIKTELDTPDKLIGQIADYRKAFGKIYVVTHHSNFYPYYQLIKGKGIGLILLDDRNKFTEHTSAEYIGKDFDHLVLFKLLRKHECISLIKKQFGSIPEVPNTLFFRECLKLIQTIPVNEFQKLVMIELKARTKRGTHSTIHIPRELQYICYTLNMKEEELFNLSNFLKVTFKP